MPVVQFPADDVAVRIVIAAACGLLIGLERQWAHKDLGVRTFAIVSVIGALAALVSSAFVLAGFVGVIVLVAIAGGQSMVLRNPAETTTSAALMATYTLGALAGEGHVFTPSASVILITLLLSLKPQLQRFTVGLTQQEVRGAVLLALLAFVIYPLVPNRFIDPWKLLNPREAWLIIVLISALGFVNYILLRVFNSRGLYYSAVFGGLINSTAAIAELSAVVKAAGEPDAAPLLSMSLLTLVSMFVRNLALLAAISWRSASAALGPIAAMAIAAGIAIALRRESSRQFPPLKLSSPLRLRKVATFGLLFIAIQIASTVAQRALGTSGLAMASLLGGFASSASSTAAAASLAANGRVDAHQAAVCTVLASIASMFANLPIVPGLVRTSAAICAAGLLILFLEVFLFR